MQVLLEQANGIRVPFPMDSWGLDRIRLDQLVKSGKVYHVIKTDKVEVISLSRVGMN